jgi:lysozyme
MSDMGQLGSLIGGAAAVITESSTTNEPTFSVGNLLIDVSHHQGVIDYKKVKEDPQGVKGVIIKSTEGASTIDSMFLKNVKGCIANNIPWSLYHFATWNSEDEVLDGKTEATFFLKALDMCPSKNILPLFLDIESNDPIPYTKDEMVTYVKSFTDTVKAAGHKIGIYASPSFLTTYLPSNHPFTDMKLWVADYGGPINPFPGWKKAWLHQYTDKGTISGIKYNVDMNKIV